MRFRKFVLCMLIMVMAFGFSNIKAYAAEVTTNGQEPQSNTEENVLELENIQENQGNETVAEKETIEVETAGENAELTDNEAVTAQENTGEEQKEDVQEINDEHKDIKEQDTTDAEEVTEEKDTSADEEKKQTKAAKKYTNAELRLLSALIYCEAQGESYNGKLAVGIVVMNRKRSSRYPDTVKGVIYQRYQFSPVSSGSLKTALRQYDKGFFTSKSEKDCIKAAKAALSGTTELTISGKKVKFSKYLSFSGSLRGYTYRIGNHKFK